MFKNATKVNSLYITTNAITNTDYQRFLQLVLDNIIIWTKDFENTQEKEEGICSLVPIVLISFSRI